MADSSGSLGGNGDLGHMVDLVVNLGSDLLDNRGSHNMLVNLVDGDNSRGSMVSDSRGSMVGNSRGSSDGGSCNSRGSSIDSRGSGNSGGRSSSINSSGGSGKDSSGIASTDETCASITSTEETSTSIASTEETTSDKLSISLSCGSSDGSSHKGRQSDEGLHIDLC